MKRAATHKINIDEGGVGRDGGIQENKDQIQEEEQLERNLIIFKSFLFVLYMGRELQQQQ